MKTMRVLCPAGDMFYTGMLCYADSAENVIPAGIGYHIQIEYELSELG